MDVEKIISKTEKKLEKKKKTVKVFKLERKHFKKEVTNQQGFGFQDLKKKPKKLIRKMFEKGMDPIFEHVGSFEVIIRTK